MLYEFPDRLTSKVYFINTSLVTFVMKEPRKGADGKRDGYNVQIAFAAGSISQLLMSDEDVNKLLDAIRGIKPPSPGNQDITENIL